MIKVEATALTPLVVGDVVTVGRACMGAPAGARAVVVERYQIGRRVGWTLLFQTGDHDGFSPDDLVAFEVRKVSAVAPLGGYRFLSAGQLRMDHALGMFADVWR